MLASIRVVWCVCVCADDFNVYALDEDTGVVQWVFATGGSVRSTPTIAANNPVYFGSQDNNVYAVNGATGLLVWNYTTGSKVLGSASVGSKGTVYIPSVDGFLYAIE